MDEIQQKYESEWKIKFPCVSTPKLCNNDEKGKYVDVLSEKPREIVQTLYNNTRKRSQELKSQLEQCEFTEAFLHGLLIADNDVVDCHLYRDKHTQNNALETCLKSTVNLNKGILLESDIDDDANCKNNQQHSRVTQERDVLPEQKLVEPPKSELITTQKCDSDDSNIDIHSNTVQDLKHRFNHVNHRKWNSAHEPQVTINSDPLPRKFSEPSKIRPLVPPRKDKVSSGHFEDEISEIKPIPSVGEPKFKSTITVGEDLSAITHPGKNVLQELDLHKNVNINSNCNNSKEEKADNSRLSPGNSNTEINKDNPYLETEDEEMRKIKKKISKENDSNVVVTSFKKIGQKDELVTTPLDAEEKNVHVVDPNNRSPTTRTLNDKPPGIPERKPSMDISDLRNATTSQKRQCRNDYENISLDFILTRSQQTVDIEDSDDDDDELYDNVAQFKKHDHKKDVSDTKEKASNNLDTLSISSGGDNSTSSTNPSPTAIHDHAPSFRDSVFINDEGKIVKEGKLLKDVDGSADNDLDHVTEIRVSKTTDDEDSPEDTISCDSLDDTKCHEIERIRQERQKKLHMRKIVVKGILESEKTYLQVLQEITLVKRTLQTKSLQEHKLCPLEDLSTIFYKIEEIKQYHQTFINNLEDKVNNWSDEQQIGDIFKELTFYIPVYKDYVDNLNKAKELLHKSASENAEFKRMVSSMEIHMNNGYIENTSLEEALFKPVQRLQRNTLVLHDLLRHTPEDHPDYTMLNKALSLADLNIKSIGEEESNTSSNKKPKDEGHLVKSGFVVEVVGHSRKLRFLFLYSDIIVCTKHKVSGRHKVKSFDVKWFIPIHNVNVDTKSTDDSSYSCKDDIDAMKKRIVSLKSELRREVRKSTDSLRGRSWSIAGKVSSRNIEKLRKKIEEQEAQLVLSSPHLPLHIQTRDEDSKDYIILISTDFEREEWRDAILSQQKHPHGLLNRELSFHGIQTTINKSTQLPQVNNIGNVLSKKDEEMLSGLLNVTIHNLNGLEQPCDVYVVLELDSYGHFFKKAQTHKCMNTTDPAWDEDFELELDGSQTIRILCYKVASPSHILIGRSALELSKEWLSSSFKEQKICMNEISLTISVRHTTTAKTLKRTPSKLQGGIFGFRISQVTKREGKTIPTFVSACLREVEAKGMDEVGIYRISGVTSEIQKIKKAFDKNLRAGLNILADADIHAVTGALKLYFRELPEPLFTEASYPQFVDTLGLADEDSKEKCMLQLLHNLPDVNYYCIVSMIEHLVKVSKHELENKMSLNNLATIFGPTLLHPAVKDDSRVNPAVLMMQGAQDVFTQAGVLYYFLTLVHCGKSIRKSSTLI